MTRYSYRLTQNEPTELEAIKNGRTLGRTVLSAQAILLMDKSDLTPPHTQALASRKYLSSLDLANELSHHSGRKQLWKALWRR